MGLFTSSKPRLPWVDLTSSEQLHTLLSEATDKPVLLFKHSTRCSISSMALNQFEREWESGDEKCTLVYLDLLAYRPLSNEIESTLRVMHQSPQAILVKNNEVLYSATHSAISADEISALL